MSRRRVWPKGGGVYAVLIGGVPQYVGLTFCFSSRFISHKCALRKGNSPNKGLQTAYNQVDDLSFQVLENLTPADWRIERVVERAWIMWLQQTKGLVNVEHVTKGAGGAPLETLGLELKVGPKDE